MLARSAFAALALAAATSAAPAAGIEYLGRSRVALESPHDLVLSPDGTRLYVSDVGHGRIAVLDPATLAEIGSFGEGFLSDPHDVDIGPDGRAYVADTHNHRIVIFEMVGAGAMPVGELKGRIQKPEGVVVHPNGRIYATGAGSGNLVAFEDGQVVAEFPGLSSPHDVDVAPDGTIWVSEPDYNRMLQFTPDLQLIRQLEGPPYDFDGVRYQALLPDGTMFAADKFGHAIKIIGPDLSVLAVIEGGGGNGPGEMTNPEGVDARGDLLWVSDSGNNRVITFRVTLP